MKQARIEEIAGGIAPPIYADAEDKVYAMTTTQLQAFAGQVIGDVARKVLDLANAKKVDEDNGRAFLDALKQLKVEV